MLTPADEVARLVGPGREVWLALDQPCTLADLSAAVSRRLGRPVDGPDGGEAAGGGVARFVAELRALDLVVDAPG